MKRRIEQLKNREFDLLIIGAGSHGACAARDAALRGLSVALIDKGDIGGATSHNSLKTIHGGIRYLQHLNIKRTLESIKEQHIWLKTAPHLVKPLPFLMPTYGHGVRGPIAMLLGVTLFRLLGFKRNKGLLKHQRLPAGCVIGKAQCLELAPNINADKLSGGAMWYDAQVAHADRAIIQLCQHASELGAEVANYVKLTALIVEDGAVTGAKAIDLHNAQPSQKPFTIRAKTVLNASGPWASELLSDHAQLCTPMSLIKSMNLVTNLPAPKTAIAVQSQLGSDSAMGETKRLYFVVPWQGQTVVGTTHFTFDGRADELSIEHADILNFIDEINHAYPSMNLTKENVLYCYQGLSPEGHSSGQDHNALQLHESLVIDHAKQHKVSGLVSIFSVKWTTARLVAQHAIDMIANKLHNTAQCVTEDEPLVDTLKLNYDVHTLNENALGDFCRAHIEHSLTTTLSDLLLRRTDDTVLGKLSFSHVKILAKVMREYWEWDEQQQRQQVTALLDNWLPQPLREKLENHDLWS